MDKPYTILTVHNYYQIGGGEDTVFSNEKRLLEEHGHQVIAYTRNNSEIKEFPLWKKLLFPLSSLFNWRTYRDIKRLIRQHQVDIVHVHNTLALISPAVYYAAIHCGVPIVQTIHNYRLLCPNGTFFRHGHICEECLQHGLYRSLRHRCYRSSLVQTFMAAACLKLHRWLGIYPRLHYICMTPFLRDKILQSNKHNKKPLINPNQVYIKPHFTEESSQPRQEGEFYLYIGRVEPLKGIDLLIEAFSQLPDLRLMIVGGGKQWETYQASARGKNCSNITVTGPLQHNKLSAILANAKALILPSQCYETFGMVIIEAYAHSVPALAGRISGFPDLILPGKTGLLFTYNSAASLKECIIQFEHQHQPAWNEAAQHEYKTKYSPEVNYRMLINIYHNSLQNDRGN